MRDARLIRAASLILLVAMLCPISRATAGIIGVFTEVEGQVTFLRDDHYFKAAEGVEVEDLDLIEVANSSSTQIEMIDGSVLRLGANSSLLLSEYQVTRTNSVIAASLEVLSGWLRFAVTKLSQGGTYQFNTPTLTIGIRGTEGVIETSNEQGGLLLEEGLVEVSAQDELAGRISPVHVAAGEFIERRQGIGFRHLRQPPAAFRRRLPLRLRLRVERRIGRLAGRRLAPAVLRRMSQDDIHRYLRQHAPLRHRLERRFQLQRQPGVRRPGARVRQRQPARVQEQQRSLRRATPRRRAIRRVIRRH